MHIILSKQWLLIQKSNSNQYCFVNIGCLKPVNDSNACNMLASYLWVIAYTSATIEQFIYISNLHILLPMQRKVSDFQIANSYLQKDKTPNTTINSSWRIPGSNHSRHMGRLQTL